RARAHHGKGRSRRLDGARRRLLPQVIPLMNSLALYTTGAFLVTLAGGTLPLLHVSWSRTQMWRLLALGSGALLGTAFMHLLPEAWALEALWAGWGCLMAI